MLKECNLRLIYLDDDEATAARGGTTEVYVQQLISEREPRGPFFGGGWLEFPLGNLPEKINFAVGKHNFRGSSTIRLGCRFALTARFVTGRFLRFPRYNSPFLLSGLVRYVSVRYRDLKEHLTASTEDTTDSPENLDRAAATGATENQHPGSDCLNA